jgi:hypothetical protein
MDGNNPAGLNHCAQPAEVNTVRRYLSRAPWRSQHLLALLGIAWAHCSPKSNAVLASACTPLCRDGTSQISVRGGGSG